ncbi:hypothetical protein GCM10009039_08900 [Halocalculus aciditolerans]|uniref:DUF5786 domain-containing protein n=2 Tax=Halocalculus aciditolerans TaxID=1383812 RepID=A0A830F9N4_9EURY|nr:hypothetical protein GCM10009039_08900 [Halocalculus aciditolerans]
MQANHPFRAPRVEADMGFGSYDESEQENQQSDSEYDEDDVLNVHENDHEGEVSFDTDASQDELIGRLQDMKDDEDDE